MKLSEKLKEKRKTIYQEVAEKYGVTTDYVGFIARGKRKAVRGKGLMIRTELETMANIK